MNFRLPIILAGGARRGTLAALLAGVLIGAGGCATGPNPYDPFEPFNRKMMQFNEGVDAVALKPAATAYREILPPLVRTGVSNFFGNLGDVWSFVNSLLQLRLQAAGENFMRVNVNTVFGLGGILDVASELHIERHKEDFGQTLGRWGVPTGPYLVLPLLGPSTLRDTIALPIDRQGNPVHYVDPWDTRYSLYALHAIDVRANLLRAGSVLDEAALDKYSFTRDAHLQRRRSQIFDTEKPSSFRRETEPDDGSIPALPPDAAEPADAAAPPAGAASGPAGGSPAR
jgi:phospholipid-binding lipoprotein MlaA